MLKEFFAEFQDGIDTPQLRGHTEAESFSTVRSFTEQEPTANVDAHGAAGDGATDDSAAIQSALDEQAGPVYFPPGQYLVTQTLTVPDNATIVFDERATVVRGSGFDVFDVGASNDVSFKNPHIDGAGYDGHLIVSDGADGLNVSDGYLRNTAISGQTSLGVLSENGTDVHISGVHLADTGATWGGIRTTNCTDVRVSDCYVEETRHHGISFIGTDNVTAHGNVVYRNGWKDTTTGGTGIHSDTGSHMNWTGNSVINSYGGGIKTQTDDSVVSSNLVKRTNSAEAAGIIIGNPSCLVSSNRVVTDTDVRGVRILSDDAYVVGNKIEATGTSTMVGVTLEGNNNRVVWNDVQGFSSNYNDTGTGNYRFDRLSKDFGNGEYGNHAATPRSGARAYFAESVGQSSVELGRAGTATAAMYLVQGEDPAGDRYADLLLATFSSVTTVASIADGTIGRSYTASSNTLSGQFDSGSSNGDMQVFGWGV